MLMLRELYILHPDMVLFKTHVQSTHNVSSTSKDMQNKVKECAAQHGFIVELSQMLSISIDKASS